MKVVEFKKIGDNEEQPIYMSSEFKNYPPTDERCQRDMSGKYVILEDVEKMLAHAYGEGYLAFHKRFKEGIIAPTSEDWAKQFLNKEQP